MFIGEYQHTIDPKGRVIVPSKLREGLGENFVLAKGFDDCLFAYSLAGFKELEEKLNRIPITDKEGRNFARFFFAGASECEVDKQGRILIPQNLRTYAGLEKDLYIIGVSSRVEIWDKTKLDEHNSGENIKGDKLAEKIEKYLI